MARKSKRAIVDELIREFRVSGNQDDAFDSLAAKQLGISESDLLCLNIVENSGGLSAGELAAKSGLTAGAITGVIDRLEKAGLVRRERDETDRRKVFIAVVPETAMKIGQLYVPMQQAMEKVFSAYTDEELRLLLRFASEGYKSILAATAALKGLLDTPPEKRPDLKLKKRSRQP